jgi:uncharacterized protein YbjQ (UPF0145 family)
VSDQPFYSGQQPGHPQGQYPPPAQARFVEVATSTTFGIEGHRIVRQLGTCFGLVVRSVGFAKGFTGSFRALRAGEVPEYTQVLEDARRHAMDRMVQNCQVLGGNAVIGVRFDSSDVGGQGLTEIVAYGTAVYVEPAG